MSAEEPFVVHRSRPKFALLVIVSGLFAIVGAIGGASGGGWALWFAAVFFGPLCIFAVTQLVNRKPAVVIDAEGITDHRSGLELSWAEVQGVQVRTIRTRYSRQYFLNLRVEDIDRVVERLPKRFGRAVGRLDAKLGVREAAVPMNMLDRSRKEILDAVRRVFRGPVEA